MSVQETPEGVWQVLCDSQPRCTPAGVVMNLPTRALAQAIADEWAGVRKGQRLQPHHIPLTQYVNTALDHIRPAREATIEGWLSAAHADVLCYRAEDSEELIARQKERWDPWLSWADNMTGACLEVTQGVMPLTQSADSLECLRRAAASLDDFRLMALTQATGLLGSSVLGLACVQGALSAPEALHLSLLDEIYQSEQWGEPEDMTQRRNGLMQEMETLSRFLGCLEPLQPKQAPFLRFGNATSGHNGQNGLNGQVERSD